MRKTILPMITFVATILTAVAASAHCMPENAPSAFHSAERQLYEINSKTTAVLQAGDSAALADLGEQWNARMSNMQSTFLNNPQDRLQEPVQCVYAKVLPNYEAVMLEIRGPVRDLGGFFGN